MKTIVYANTIDYDFKLQQRPHHIMNILANRGYKIHWINNTKSVGKQKTIINDNLEVYHDFSVYSKRNPNPDIYFSTWSNRYKDLEFLNPKMVIYDSLDNFEANESEEMFMVRSSDVVLATSKKLLDLRSQQHYNVVLCRNGCFPELGNVEYDIPKEYQLLKQNGLPILLFSGALAHWCDIDIVELLSTCYNVVIVGLNWNVPKDRFPQKVTFLGHRTYKELQAYYHHCDINLLPFRRCQVSDYSNPIKMYEGMSHGKITVSTDIPEACDLEYKNVVLTSKNKMEFLKNIQRALNIRDNSIITNLCKSIANENSWYNRVDVIENEINKFFNKG